MPYSFAANLKLKKYYEEPVGKYNIVSTVVFRLEDNYKSMSEYHDQFMYMIKNFKYIYGNDYYLRVYFDRSIYKKTGNKDIDKEIDKMWLPLLKYLKSLPFVQLCRYKHHDFKKNETFHLGLFGTIIRFIPLFDYNANKNIKTVVITDIDVNKYYLSLSKQSLNYMESKKLNFFFKTSYCKFIAGRHYMAHGIANTWLRVMAGTVICDNYKFPHQILDYFFEQAKTGNYDDNVKKFVKMDIYNYHEYKTQTDHIYKYGIDEFFAMYLVKDVLQKNIKFGYLAARDIDASIWLSYVRSNKFTDGKYNYEKMMRSVLGNYYNNNKTVQENYDYFMDKMRVFFIDGKPNAKEKEIRNNMIRLFEQWYKNGNYDEYGFTLDEIKCVLFQKDRTEKFYEYDAQRDAYDSVFE
jgi:hypothetical protein